MRRYAIGIDIGGTKIASGIVDDTGKIIIQKIIPTDLSISVEEMVARVSEAVESLTLESGISLKEIAGIGIGAPGPLDTLQGRIVCPPNLPTWADTPIVELFAKHFSLPIVLENDATAATLAEKWIGAGQDCEDFVFMTVSTGVGAGIYANGKLITGAKGNAGDIGHMVVNPAYGACTCGQHGCLESIASGTAIAKRVSALLGQELNAEAVFNLYNEGNEAVIELVDKLLKEIGVACVSLINTFDLEKIIIGGGVSKVGDILFKAVTDYVRKYALSPAGRETVIIQAKLEQDAGLIGAAKLCL